MTYRCLVLLPEDALDSPLDGYRSNLKVHHSGEQGCDIHLVLTNIHVYIHQKCIYTYIHIHIHQDLVLWQLPLLQT